MMDMVREVAFLNDRGLMKPDDFAFAVEALRIQVERDFLPLWQDYLPVKRPVEVVGYSNSDNLSAGSFAPIQIVPSLETPGYLGDHGGLALPDLAWGRSQPIPTVMGHEALELIGDPYGDRWVRMASGIVTALEVCDAVENDHYTIAATIGRVTRDVEVSNFVCPAWFGEGVGRLDFMGTCTEPGDYSHGYIIVENDDGSTSNVFGSKASVEYIAAVTVKKADERSRTAYRHDLRNDRVYILPGNGPGAWTAE
jgi:hypothetical protein